MHRQAPLKVMIVTLLLFAIPIMAEVLPTSMLQTVRPLSQVAVLQLPPVDAAQAAKQDETDLMLGEPLRFAVPEQLSINPETHGTWEDLPDPRFVLWRLHVQAPRSLSLNAGFERFRLPKGGRLVIHPAGGAELAREFTERDNLPHGELWTPVILGDAMILELTLPAESRHDYELDLAHIGKGYRFFGEDRTDKAGWCNIDVICPEGDGWREEIRSSAVYTRGGTWTCSGAMINNTAQDGTPYFLTAHHCGVTGSNANSVVVYWNFESPVCGQQGGGSLSQFTSGTIFRASSSTSDFCLLELSQLPDPSWNVTYSGWDRSSADADWAVAIHHPSTDEKSISFEYDPTTTTSYLGSSSPGNGTHIRVADWDVGTTEPGSSGSPLYNQNKHIVGQLHGGYAACGNNDPDWYGRLSISWNGGGSNATRLSNWLDPLGTAPMSLDLFDPNATGLRVSPSGGLASEGNQGGPFSPAGIDYTLENQSAGNLLYSVTVDETWLEVANGSGNLPPGGDATVTVSLSSAAAGLSNGMYSGLITFTNMTNGDGDTTRPASLQVGVPAVVHAWHLDTDPGWTYEGQWAWGVPNGGGGQYGNSDPASGFTGANVLGYNLAGDYANNLPERSLTTEAIDCSDLQATSLRFRRWLNVEQPLYDKASIRVSTNGTSWTTIWENPSEITDSSWQLLEYDISALADGEPTVYLRWVMGPTDGSWQYSGWNLDDIEILGLQDTASHAPVTPQATSLVGAAPNPFNPLTEIRFTLAQTVETLLTVHDARGRLIKTLAQGLLESGAHTVVWDGTDQHGRRQGSGVYFLRLEAGEVRQTDKVVMVK
jgi:hypothetical protein